MLRTLANLLHEFGMQALDGAVFYKVKILAQTEPGTEPQTPAEGDVCQITEQRMGGLQKLHCHPFSQIPDAQEPLRYVIVFQNSAEAEMRMKDGIVL